MNLKALSDQDLVLKLKTNVGEERRLTTEILHYLHEVDSRLIFAEMGYSSLYEFCVKHLGYSDGSAYRRIQSMRLLKSLPPEEQTKAETKIKSGQISLTNLSLLQSFLEIEKKEGKTHPTDEKINLLSSIENKTKREVEKDLYALQPLIMPKEKTRVVSPELTEIKFIADAKLIKKLTRVKEVLAHVNPNPTYADLLERLADEFLERKDPLIKSERIQKRNFRSYPTKGTKNSPPAEELAESKLTDKAPPTIVLTSPQKQLAIISKSHRSARYIPAMVKHQVTARDRGCCNYEDPVTKRRCISRFGLEFDHIQPHAAGGASTVENLRLRCRTHNKLHARRVLGIRSAAGNEG